MNLDTVHQITNGDKDKQKKILNLFLSSIKKNRLNLQKSISENNEQLWQETLHEIKGSSASLGFNDLSELCASAEERHSQAKSEMSAIDSNINRITEFIKNYLSQI